MAFLLLDGPIQPYAWGSAEFLPELLGRANPERAPWAELWLGAHPGGPARVVGQGATLDQLVAADPIAMLGPRWAGRGRLPFLLKVLAAAAPLSLQCHPDAAQAAAGFAREQGLAADDPARRYRDAEAKPELVVALTRFTALAGFRAAPEIAARFAGLGAGLPEPERADGLRGFLAALLALAPAEVATLCARATTSGEPAAAWVGRLADAYPGDPAALAPLFLHLVELAPGEAMFLRARQLHAYLAGAALELQGSSDNVLRAGLSHKPIDRAELLAVLEPGAHEPDRLGWLAAGDLARLPARAAELDLHRGELAGSAWRRERSSLEIALCTRGRIELRAGGERLALDRGQAAAIPYAVGDVELVGAGEIFLAGAGAAP